MRKVKSSHKQCAQVTPHRNRVLFAQAEPNRLLTVIARSYQRARRGDTARLKHRDGAMAPSSGTPRTSLVTLHSMFPLSWVWARTNVLGHFVHLLAAQ